MVPLNKTAKGSFASHREKKSSLRTDRQRTFGLKTTKSIIRSDKMTSVSSLLSGLFSRKNPKESSKSSSVRPEEQFEAKNGKLIIYSLIGQREKTSPTSCERKQTKITGCLYSSACWKNT